MRGVLDGAEGMGVMRLTVFGVRSGGLFRTAGMPTCGVGIDVPALFAAWIFDELPLPGNGGIFGCEAGAGGIGVVLSDADSAAAIRWDDGVLFGAAGTF